MEITLTPVALQNMSVGFVSLYFVSRSTDGDISTLASPEELFIDAGEKFTGKF